MKTQLLDILKEKWTKKSTKIACASVGTVAVLGVVGVLVACNVPLTKQVVAEDGTVTTVQTQQKESHGILDLFHAPTESADAAQNTTTEITPPQTSADGTPINTPAGVTAPAQSTATNGNVGEAPAAPAQATDAASAPDPAPVQAASATPAAEQSAAAAEQSAAPAPKSDARQEMPRTNVHGGVYMPNINCYKVIDDPGQRNIPEKAHYIHGWLTGGKFFDNWEETRAYSVAHRVSTGTYQKKIIDAPGQAGRPVVYHYETLEGKRISPNITGYVPA